MLSNIGWVIQDNTFARYDESSEDFSAHKAILSVAAVLLGPGTTALALVKTTHEALQSMNENSEGFQSATVTREGERILISVATSHERHSPLTIVLNWTRALSR